MSILKTPLKNIRLSTNMMDASQISSVITPISDTLKTKLSEEYFNNFCKTGRNVEKINANLYNDVTDDGGFYGIADGGENVILGTYESGIYYMNKIAQNILPCNLTAVIPSDVDLESEKTYFATCRVRNIVHGNIGYVAVSYDKTEKKSRFYKSTDGINWTMTKKIDEQANIATMPAYVKDKGYCIAVNSTLWVSTDLNNWKSISLSEKLGTRKFTVSIYDENNNKLFIVPSSCAALVELDIDKIFQDIPEITIVKQINFNVGASNIYAVYTYVNNDDTIIMFGLNNPNTILTYNVNTNDVHEPTTIIENGVQTARFNNAIRGIDQYNGMFLAACYTKRIYASMDGYNWYVLLDESDDAAVKGIEGFLNTTDNKMYYITRHYSLDYKAAVKKLIILNDEIVNRQIEGIRSYASPQHISQINTSLSDLHNDMIYNNDHVDCDTFGCSNTHATLGHKGIDVKGDTLTITNSKRLFGTKKLDITKSDINIVDNYRVYGTVDGVGYKSMNIFDYDQWKSFLRSQEINVIGGTTEYTGTVRGKVTFGQNTVMLESYDKNIYTLDTCTYGNYFEVKPNTNYTLFIDLLSCTAVASDPLMGYILISDINKTRDQSDPQTRPNFFRRHCNNGYFNFTTGSNAKYAIIRLDLAEANVKSIFSNKIMLVEGKIEKKIPYVKNGNQFDIIKKDNSGSLSTYSVSLPKDVKLFKHDDFVDYVEYSNDRGYLVQYISSDSFDSYEKHIEKLDLPVITIGEKDQTLSIDVAQDDLSIELYQYTDTKRLATDDQIIETYDGNIFELSSGERKYISHYKLGNNFSYRTDTSINDYELTEVTKLCEKINKLNNKAFYNCRALIYANLENVIQIGEQAFFYDINLTSVNCPNVSSIGLYAFSSGTTGGKLLSVNISPDNNYFTTINNGSELFSKDKSTLYWVSPFKTEIEFPDECLSSKPCACQYCANVKTINTNHLEYTSTNADFSFCTSLSSIIMPNIKNIGQNCFTGSTKLKEIYVLSSNTQAVPNIYDKSFKDIPNVISVYIPTGMTSQFRVNAQWKAFEDNNKIKFIERS